MLSSHRTIGHRSLHSSTALLVASSTSRISHGPRGVSATRRDFWWGAKHKLGSNRAGKVWKGFSTRYAAGKDAARKQIYGGTFYNCHYPLHKYLQRYPAVQEWRLSSSWGKGGSNQTKSDQSSVLKKKPEEETEDDWYTRWQKREETRYNALVKRIEEDPFRALFGRKWVNWMDDAVHKDFKWVRDIKASTTNTGGDNFIPKDGKNLWEWASESLKSSDKVSGSQHPSAQKSTKDVAAIESQDQEYEFDPISMRKVPKRAPSPSSKVEHQCQGPQKSFDIPVKRWKAFVSSYQATNEPAGPTQTSSASAPPSAQDEKSWLAQEGFGSRKGHRVDHQTAAETKDVKAKPTATTKIESALDRHLRGKSTQSRDNERPTLKYTSRENTADDVDLLRSSDVRASAGLRGRIAKESNAEKQARQQKLEKEYDVRPLDRDDKLVQELASGVQVQRHENHVSMQEASDPGLPAEITQRQPELNTNTALWMNEISESEPAVSDVKKATGTQAISTRDSGAAVSKIAASADKTGKLRAQIVPLKARLDAMKADYDALKQRWLLEQRRQEKARKLDEMHEEEVKTQKIAMAAIETRGAEQTRKRDATLVEGDQHNKKTPRQLLQSLLPGEGDLSSNVHEFARNDRWYKRKAPHAMDEMDTKFQQIAKEKVLIQEIRGIYEETYGTIDTKHRQLSRPEVAAKSDTASGSLSSTSSNASPPSVGVTSPEPEQQASPTQKADAINTSDPLAIVQKLFSELRQAQTLLQEHRARLKSDPVDSSSDAEHLRDLALQAREVYRPVVMQIAKQALELGKTSGLSAAIATAAARANYPPSVRHLSKEALKATDTDTPNKATPCVYRILAYDSATESVTSAKATSLAPFSKEQQLLPVEALEVLNNPGKFLPHLMTLHNKGYSVGSGTSNILVFKKEATGDELAAAKHAEAMRGPNPIDGTVAQTGNFASPTGFVNYDSPIPLDELEASVEEQEAEPQNSDSKPVSWGTVRREEEVFSGSHRGNWQEAGGRHHRYNNRRGGRQKGMFGRMLLTGTITAACCYMIGLASEMMR